MTGGRCQRLCPLRKRKSSIDQGSIVLSLSCRSNWLLEASEVSLSSFSKCDHLIAALAEICLGSSATFQVQTSYNSIYCVGFPM